MTSALKRLAANSELWNFNQIGRDRWMRAVASSIPAGARVLDVGAGGCPYRAQFSHCTYRTQDFHALRTEQVHGDGYGAIDYVCDVCAIPVEDASFDVIVCTEVLEHLVEPAQAIAEMARILRPGGLLVLSAPLGSGIHQEPHHYYGGFTPYWYSRFLDEQGFELIDIQANGGFFRHFGQESRRFMTLSAPRHMGLAPRLFWLPFWLALWPLFSVVIPLIATQLDRIDQERRFTVGYHVTAVRRGRG